MTRFKIEICVLAVSMALTMLTYSAQAEIIPAASTAANTQSKSAQAELSLAQALDFGLSNSPRTAAARALLGITQASLVQANVLPNPGVLIDNQYQFTYKLGASMIVEPPWRLIFRRSAAKCLIAQTDLEINRTLWLFRGELRRAYVQALIARELANIRKQLLEVTNRLYSVSVESFSKGNVAKLDVHRAELAVVQAEIQVEQADIFAEQTIEQLNVLLAREKPYAEPAPLSTYTSELLDHAKALNSQQQLLALAFANRLELKIVSQRQIVNSADLKVSRGNILPAPRFSVGAMTEDKINSDKNRKTVFFQSLIDLPILDRQQGLIARARANQKQLNFELLAQKNIVIGQVLLAERRLQSALALIEQYRNRAIPVSNRILETSDLSYRLGHTNINTALLSQQENILIRTQYLDSLLAFELAMNDLEQAVGLPL